MFPRHGRINRLAHDAKPLSHLGQPLFEYRRNSALFSGPDVHQHIAAAAYRRYERLKNIRLDSSNLLTCKANRCGLIDQQV